MRNEILVETISTIEGGMIGIGMVEIGMGVGRGMRMRRGNRVDRREEATREIIRDLDSDRRLEWTVDGVVMVIEVAMEIVVGEVGEGEEATTVGEIIFAVMIDETMAIVGTEEVEVDEVAIGGMTDEVVDTDETT